MCAARHLRGVCDCLLRDSADLEAAAARIAQVGSLVAGSLEDHSLVVGSLALAGRDLGLVADIVEVEGVVHRVHIAEEVLAEVLGGDRRQLVQERKPVFATRLV